jgi:hypothetical protein
MVLENLLGFSDAYMTMADNYYVYSDPQNTGRMIYIPSDLDTTLGVALFDMNMMTSGNYSEHPGFYFRPLTRKFFSNLEFLDQYQTLLKNLTSSLVNPSVLKPHIESIVNMIQTDIEWDVSLPFIGQMVPPPVGNGEDNIPYDLMYPPGYRTNWSDVPQTFESSLYGPTNSTTTESIIGFITRKSDNVNSFYNQRV